ncbi:MAG: hypothetical protein KDB61_01920 [Planctomycetes bacterium]|nr:hypothetical protein [Planctomycetota bacterium]
MERVAVIYNPVAGRGRALGLAKLVEQRLMDSGARPEVLPTKAAGDAFRMASEFDEGIQRAFIVGGDGTLREAAGGVLEAGGHVALAHIPLGNANVVARELGVPLDAKAAVDVLMGGHAEAFDVLDVQGHLVLAMVGVGYDAKLAAGMDWARSGVGKAWYRFHGDSLYGVVGALCLMDPSQRRYALIADGQELQGDFTGCIVSNMHTYAKGWAPNPGADPQDGELDYQALKPGWMPSTAISLVAAARRKRLPQALAAHGRATELVIRSRTPFHWQADGDAMGRTPELRIRVRPQVLNLVVPAKG